MELEKLKAFLQSKTIENIENRIDKLQSAALDSITGLIEHLYYLERTKRFRENAKYQDHDFFEYIYERYRLNKSWYIRTRRILLVYPEQAKSLGLGVVQRIDTLCVNPKKTMQRIMVEESSRKKPLPKEKYEQIIREDMKPQPVKVPMPTISDIDQLKDIVQEQENRLQQQSEQLAKAQKALMKYKKEAEMWREKYDELKQQIEPLYAAASKLELVATK